MKLNLVRKSIMLSLTFALFFIVSPQFSQVNAASAKTNILLDGFPLTFSADPVAVQGDIMVPFRSIADALNISVQWDGKAKKITAVKTIGTEKKTVVLQVNSKKALVNGESVTLPVAPKQVKGNTLIPLGFFIKQFGAEVNTNSATKEINITSPQTPIYRMGFYALKSFAERRFIPEFDAVAFGWARIQEDGTITTEGKDFYWPKPNGDITPESIVGETKDANALANLMVFAGDGKGELTKMLEDAQLRDSAIADILKLANDTGFSGITLDFEGLGLTGDQQKAKDSYTDFVKRLASQAKKSGLKLSLVLHPLNSSFKGYDYKALGAAADQLVIMAYAYEGEKAPEPLAKVDEAIKLAIRETPKTKLLLGISMGSETEQSISSKIGLAKRYDLKGIALWRIGLLGDNAIEKLNESTDRQTAN